MTSVLCPECKRTIGSPTGLASHMRSMHPDVHMRNVEAARAQTARPLTSVPPPSPTNGIGIRWEDPPSGTGSRVVERFRPFVVELKRNPGRWARCIDYPGGTSASGQATALRKSFPDLEIVGRKIGDGSAIFARYNEDA